MNAPTPEQRAEWRRDLVYDDRHPAELRRRIEALLDALDAAEAKVARVEAILAAWDAWDGSRGPDGQMHPDSSSPRDRDRLRAALNPDD